MTGMFDSNLSIDTARHEDYGASLHVVNKWVIDWACWLLRILNSDMVDS